MPSSSTQGKREIHEWFGKQKDIQTVLDIGCGCGTYPKLLKDKNYDWAGIEIYAPYIEKYNLNELYDNLICGDVTKILLLDADCVILGDVVEHLKKEDAIQLMAEVDAKFKHVVISIPIEYPQGKMEGNPYEEHKSIWTYEDINNAVPACYKFRELFDNIAVFIK